MPCFYCGKRVSLVRQLTDADFCSDEHRKRYHTLTQLALNRLMEANEQLAAAPRQQGPTPAAVVVEELPAPVVQPAVAPIPAEAGFLPQATAAAFAGSISKLAEAVEAGSVPVELPELVVEPAGVSPQTAQHQPAGLAVQAAGRRAALKIVAGAFTGTPPSLGRHAVTAGIVREGHLSLRPWTGTRPPLASAFVSGPRASLLAPYASTRIRLPELEFGPLDETPHSAAPAEAAGWIARNPEIQSMPAALTQVPEVAPAAQIRLPKRRASPIEPLPQRSAPPEACPWIVAIPKARLVAAEPGRGSESGFRAAPLVVPQVPPPAVHQLARAAYVAAGAPSPCVTAPGAAPASTFAVAARGLRLPRVTFGPVEEAPPPPPVPSPAAPIVRRPAPRAYATIPQPAPAAEIAHPPALVPGLPDLAARPALREGSWGAAAARAAALKPDLVRAAPAWERTGAAPAVMPWLPERSRRPSTWSGPASDPPSPREAPAARRARQYWLTPCLRRQKSAWLRLSRHSTGLRGLASKAFGPIFCRRSGLRTSERPGPTPAARRAWNSR